MYTITTIRKGTTAVFADSSPAFPRLRISIHTRQKTAPYGNATPNKAPAVSSIPAIIAESTTTAFTSIRKSIIK
ncbi:MAG: hypothetical protein IJX05_00315 [Clostridia bacterium]|nr:hypothetical protein [Clostridia bacterium]